MLNKTFLYDMFFIKPSSKIKITCLFFAFGRSGIEHKSGKKEDRRERFGPADHPRHLEKNVKKPQDGKAVLPPRCGWDGRRTTWPRRNLTAPAGTWSTS